ncbi:MAG TPA: hypothetical protein VFM05_01750, partial [Candidatus Saccharimonadales bacterium]|nr:hypothetical protein [Candidatus Saccharimonadales bacterium]
MTHQKVRSNPVQFEAFLLSVRELSVPVGTANHFQPRESTRIEIHVPQARLAALYADPKLTTR